LDEAEHHWVFVRRLAFGGAVLRQPEVRPQGITRRVAVSLHAITATMSHSATAPHLRQRHYSEGLVS
jgi:hypothetical protein